LFCFLLAICLFFDFRLIDVLSTKKEISVPLFNPILFGTPTTNQQPKNKGIRHQPSIFGLGNRISIFGKHL